MIQKIQATEVLRKTKQAEADGYKLIIHEGGSRSSKTWSIFQHWFSKAIEGEEVIITIVRDKLSWIRSTLLKDFEVMTRLYNLPVTPNINPDRQSQVYHIYGVEFAFFGLDNAEKLHGRTQDYFWINEVMETNKKSFDQLEMRTNIAGIIDYNPADDSHWVFDLGSRDDTITIKSTMLDNPFLPEKITKKIKGYEPTPENIAMKTADDYMWQVYGLGNRARLQGAIFTKFDNVDTIPREAKLLGYGLDFGYTNDPTALIALYMFDNEIYLDELIYETGMLNSDIDARMTQLGIDPMARIVADSAEPKSIAELNSKGWRNLVGATKGQGSVNFGIDLLKGYFIHITVRSINVDKEARKYKWAEDKNGKTLNVPVDAWNHAWDAIRYIASDAIKAQKEVVIQSAYGLGI